MTVLLVVAVVIAVVLVRRARFARQIAIAGAMKANAALITFHADGTVRSVDTTKMLTDQIQSNSLSKLSDLRSLNVNHTEFTDEDVRVLCDSLDLHELSLVGTNVSDRSAAALGSQSNLRLLDARATFLSDAAIEEISTLRNLEQLRLAQTWITDAGLRKIARLTKLKFLDLRYTQVTDEGLAALTEQKSLRTVYLTGSQVSEAGVEQFQQARPEVGLRFRARDIPQAEVAWPRERRYPEGVVPPRLVQAEREIGEALEEAGASIRVEKGFIRRVDLTGKQLPLELFAKLKQLRYLRQIDFSDSNADDQSLAEFSFCPCLQFANLQYTAVTDAGMKSVGKMRGLWNLNLCGTAITDKGVSQLSRLNVLGDLVLSNTQITGQSLRLIPSDPFLSTLDVSGTKVRGEDLAIVSDRFSRHLSHLYLSGLSIADEDLRNLSTLEYLRHLDISDTAVTDAGIAWLKPLRRLRSLIALRTGVTVGGARKQMGERPAYRNLQIHVE